MKKLYEIGVGNPGICRAVNYSDCECHLFEANPNTYNQLKDSFGGRSSWCLYNCAIADYNGKIKFSMDGDSSYISNIAAPTIQCAPLEYVNSREIVEVDCFKISEFDKNDIDILLLDMEGSEFFVLKYLISRPEKIIIEMDNGGRGYINPFYSEIVDWMNANNYKMIDKNEDAIFIKNENK